MTAKPHQQDENSPLVTPRQFTIEALKTGLKIATETLKIYIESEAHNAGN